MAVIENPILNSPFREPTRHFTFDHEGITDEILNGRRPSSHFVPIPRAKKKGKQLQFETEWTKDRIEPNPVVDRIRQRVNAWRRGDKKVDFYHHDQRWSNRMILGDSLLVMTSLAEKEGLK